MNPLAGKEELLSQLNPEKIYVENVRSLLGVSYRSAEAICETAARQGYFRKQVEVMCPDGAVAAVADTEETLPPKVKCQIEEDGVVEEEELDTKTLPKTIFYKLNERTSTAHA